MHLLYTNRNSINSSSHAELFFKTIHYYAYRMYLYIYLYIDFLKEPKTLKHRLANWNRHPSSSVAHHINQWQQPQQRRTLIAIVQQYHLFFPAFVKRCFFFVIRHVVTLVATIDFITFRENMKYSLFSLPDWRRFITSS